MDLNVDSIEFFILAYIVDTIIGDIFFQNDEQLLNDNNNDNDTATIKVITKKAAKKSKEKVNHEIVRQTIQWVDVQGHNQERHAFWTSDGPCFDQHVVLVDNNNHPTSQGSHQDD